MGPMSNLCLKRQKKIKREECSFFGGNQQWVELEREMRETPPSLYDLRRSSGRNPSSQDLKFIYSTRATRGYRQYTVSLKLSGLEKKS